MATGVLVICLGRATRLIPILHEFRKTYVAGFTLGQTSDTDDATGVIQPVTVDQAPTESQLQRALRSQTGKIMQAPPAFSAIRIQGRRAYQAARAGQSVALKPRPVSIYSIDLLKYEFPVLTVKIECGSGTYIRSIARDVGNELNCGGLMHELSRTAIGPFGIETAVSSAAIDQDSLQPVEAVFQECASRHELSESEIQQLRHGRKLQLDRSSETVVALTADGRFAARLRRCDLNSDWYQAEINWVPLWFAQD